MSTPPVTSLPPVSPVYPSCHHSIPQVTILPLLSPVKPCVTTLPLMSVTIKPCCHRSTMCHQSASRVTSQPSCLQSTHITSQLLCHQSTAVSPVNPCVTSQPLCHQSAPVSPVSPCVTSQPVSPVNPYVTSPPLCHQSSHSDHTRMNRGLHRNKEPFKKQTR